VSTRSRPWAAASSCSYRCPYEGLYYALKRSVFFRLDSFCGCRTAAPDMLIW